MITKVPLLNKVFKINTMNAKKDKQLQANLNELSALLKDPKVIAYFKKVKDEGKSTEQYLNSLNK